MPDFTFIRRLLPCHPSAPSSSCGYAHIRFFFSNTTHTSPTPYCNILQYSLVLFVIHVIDIWIGVELVYCIVCNITVDVCACMCVAVSDFTLVLCSSSQQCMYHCSFSAGGGGGGNGGISACIYTLYVVFSRMRLEGRVVYERDTEGGVPLATRWYFPRTVSPMPSQHVLSIPCSQHNNIRQYIYIHFGYCRCRCCYCCCSSRA